MKTNIVHVSQIRVPSP